MSILIQKKIQLRAVFFRKNSLSCEKKIKFSLQNKKAKAESQFKKDSRKSVLNQTHIVGHGKPEKQISGTKNFTGTRAKPEAKIRWSSYDADSYMGRSRQGQSAYLFSTKTKI